MHAKKFNGKGTNRQTKISTDGHRDYETKSAQWADSVKNNISEYIEQIKRLRETKFLQAKICFIVYV